MRTHFAETAEDLEECCEILSQLRVGLSRSELKAAVERLRSSSGYKLVCTEDRGAVVAVAGFRIAEMLSRGRFLYVDDLVTDPSLRSRGYGASLLGWLAEFAGAEGCGELHLDSGTHRTDAHRFYRREGLEASSLHFRGVL